MRQWDASCSQAESSDAESSNADLSLVPNIDQEDVVVDAADDDSSDDDIVDETVKEMHEILVKVPPFQSFARRQGW